MKDAGLSRRQLLKGAGAVGVLGALGIPTTVFAEGGTDGRLRWDIISLIRPDIRAGGEGSATAEGESMLTLTGSGTFRPGHPRQVTGGGTWSTNNLDVAGGPGTYRVTELVSWVPAPGTLAGAPLIDHIGNLADVRAGLAVFRIKYSDGLGGILFVSCNLAGTPKSVDEGINASRGFVNFFHPEMPNFTKHSNRTAFHVLTEEEKE